MQRARQTGEEEKSVVKLEYSQGTYHISKTRTRGYFKKECLESNNNKKELLEIKKNDGRVKAHKNFKDKEMA